MSSPALEQVRAFLDAHPRFASELDKRPALSRIRLLTWSLVPPLMDTGAAGLFVTHVVGLYLQPTQGPFPALRNAFPVEENPRRAPGERFRAGGRSLTAPG